MKNIEELKQEQYGLKARLHGMIEFINSKDYFALSSEEKTIISIQMAGMELYLNCLTQRIYGNMYDLEESDFESHE